MYLKIVATRPKEREIRVVLSVEEAQLLADILYDDANLSENERRKTFAGDLKFLLEEALLDG